MLRNVAWSVQQLQIFPIVRAAHRKRYYVVNVDFFAFQRLSTTSAAIALQFSNLLYIFRCKITASVYFSRTAAMGVNLYFTGILPGPTAAVLALSIKILRLP